MGEKKRMNKRAFFVSASALVILLIVILMFAFRGEEALQRSKLDSEYRSHKFIADYVTDMEDIYLPSLISVSQKFAFKNISEEVASFGPGKRINTLDDVKDVIMTGNYKGTPVMPIGYTLSSLINDSMGSIQSDMVLHTFDFTVDGIYQDDSWSICMNSTVHFKIVSGDINWSNNKPYSTCMSVNGLMHPNSPPGLIDKNINKFFWEVNSSAPHCFLASIYNGYACGTVEGICPVPIAGACCDLFGVC